MKTIHTLLFLTLLCLPSAASAQAAGVKIIEQSPAGLTQENDQVAEKVAELAAQKRLLDQQTILGQIKQPVPQKLDLPAPSQKALSPADIAAKARASVVRVGWTFLCDKCNHWHLELGGGYPITADGAIATCAHVLKTPKMKDGSLIVVDSDNNVYPVTSIIAHDTTMDAAIVKIDHSLVPFPWFRDRVGQCHDCHGLQLKPFVLLKRKGARRCRLCWQHLTRQRNR